MRNDFIRRGLLMAKKTQAAPEQVTQDMGTVNAPAPEQVTDLGGLTDKPAVVEDMGQLPPLPKFYKYKGGK